MEVNGSILIQIAIFLGILFSLSKMLFAPILAVFEKRDELIKDTKKDALSTREKALHLKQEYEQRLKENKKETLVLFSESKAQIQKECEKAINQTKQESLAQINANEAKVTKELGALRGSLDTMGSELAKDILANFNKSLT